ncbi:RNA-guided endonuclease IscB [Nonomuraea sp. NPDC049269]|uniref:RNA-guided endonuclease IscB n=1 Tax=Nonomuraea sp. NPDC049269 TaxID=3364349 RepID=UPI00371A9E8A
MQPCRPGRARQFLTVGQYSVRLDHRGAAIRDKLAARSQYRRGRRSRKLRYRAPRFLNRTRPKGWLAPSLQHRVDTTLSWLARLRRWAPVRAVHVERVSFDTHAMSAGKPLEGIEYQQGTLAGYAIRQYLLKKWGRTCAYCGAAGTPLQVEHTGRRRPHQRILRHHHRNRHPPNIRLLQRADGYGYTTRQENTTER